MKDALFLALRSLAYHRWRSGLLVLVLAWIAFVPACLRILVHDGAAALTARAAATPLVIGARGSPLELVLSSLYFQARTPPVLPYSAVAEVGQDGGVAAIPLHVRFRSRGHPLVGTSLEYFDFRGLRVANGRPLALLGECVVGAAVARQEHLAPGDRWTTSTDNVFDLAGAYPLRMPVVGVLAPTHGPDDEAVFVDVKTAWVLEGLGHGHQDLRAAAADAAVLSRTEHNVVANASLVQAEEITDANRDTFHFHGDVGAFPLTAVLAVPADDRQSTLLQGRYQDDPARQVVRPDQVLDDLLDTVFTVQGFVVAALAFVGAATLLTAALVFALSVQLRRRELWTLRRIGASRGRVTTMLAMELLMLVALALALAGILTAVAARYGGEWLRNQLLA